MRYANLNIALDNPASLNIFVWSMQTDQRCWNTPVNLCYVSINYADWNEVQECIVPHEPYAQEEANM